MTRKKSDMGQKQSKKTMRKKRNRIKMIAFFIIIILILVSLFSYWHYILRPINLEELSRREFKAGDSIKVKGTITEIEKHNTTYGPLTLISLDDYDPESITYKLIADNDNVYTIGDDFQTELTFEEYFFNGVKITTGDRLFNTYFMPIYMNQVLKGVSFNSGIFLVHKSNDGNGNTVFEVVTTNNYGLSLNLFNISLRKGATLTDDSYDHRDSFSYFGEEYMHLSGNYYMSDEIDFMESLEDVVSENKIIEFSDVDSDGLLSDGDILKIHIPPTKNKHTIETYCLNIGHG